MSFLLVNVEVFFSCSGYVRFYTDPDPSDPYSDFVDPGASRTHLSAIVNKLKFLYTSHY
jgi:hypothetical protein